MGNKVPYETCEFVPSVKCHLVLKKVAELECVPVVNEECNDFAKEIPYLVGEEECEEVVYDDCFEVSITAIFGRKCLYNFICIFWGIASPASFRLKNKCQSFFAKEHVLTTSQSFFRGARSSSFFALTVKYYFISELVYYLNFFVDSSCVGLS